MEYKKNKKNKKLPFVVSIYAHIQFPLVRDRQSVLMQSKNSIASLHQ